MTVKFNGQEIAEILLQELVYGRGVIVPKDENISTVLKWEVRRGKPEKNKLTLTVEGY